MQLKDCKVAIKIQGCLMSIRNAYRQGFMAAGMGYDNPYAGGKDKAAWYRGAFDAENGFQFQPPLSGTHSVKLSYCDVVMVNKPMYFKGGL